MENNDQQQSSQGKNTHGGVLVDQPVPRAKRKYGWYLGPVIDDEDEYLNKREPDGSLAPLTHSLPLPTIDTEDAEIKEILEMFDEVNSRPCYDPEMIALGDLPRSLWFLLPDNEEPETATLELVGNENRRFNVTATMCAGIYHLAKTQLPDETEEDRTKWAVLRLEMYKAGWFDNQPMVRRVALANDFVATFNRESEKIKQHELAARKLCSFVPFLIEHSFRSYGVGYTESSEKEFCVRAHKFANSAKRQDVLSYMNPDILYGKAFRWIGVKRPRDVLEIQKFELTIPSVFKDKINEGPAGQALITSSFAVIESLKSKNWWTTLKDTGKYDDTIISTVNGKIKADPCKYHIVSSAYGCPSLTRTEDEEVEEAKRQATLLAPLLQAYCDTILAHTSLGKVKALRRPSNANSFLYSRFKSLFAKAKRQKIHNIADL